MSRLERLPPWAVGAEPPYQTHDLNVLAATLAAGEIGSEHTQHLGWIARYAPDPETIGYLDHVIPGPTSIMDLRGSLGRSLQHTLLRYEAGHQWPFVEKWELNWSVADPVEYQHRRVPTWIRDELNLTKPLPDRYPRRGNVRGIAVETRP